MLTYAEEILVLALDDATGKIKPLPHQALRYALAGALLMQLAMTGRIDTDLEGLHLIDPSPTDDPLMDEVLQRMQAADGERPTGYWLQDLAWEVHDVQERVLASLVDKGVLRVQDERILWVFAVRRYPLLYDRDVKEVRARLRELIEGDELPTPEEAVLVALVEACQLFDELFTREELTRLHPRIMALARMELIGREVTRSIREISRAVAASIPAMM